MTAVNIEKRKIFKRRRDGQVAQGGSVSVSVSSSPSSSEGEFNPAILQDYAKKVDVHAPSQKALLDALSVEAGYIKYQAAALSIDNADKLGGVVAASYARKDTVNTYEYDQTINADLYVNGNIIQNGSAYETHAEHLNVENNLMQLNVGEPGSQITGVIPGTAIPFSGIEINRGTPDPYYMGVVEGVKPLLKLGKKDSLEAIATRADDISDDFLLSWDLAGKRIVGKRLASDYWHKDNSNLSNIDWNARNIRAYGTLTVNGVATLSTSLNLGTGFNATAYKMQWANGTNNGWLDFSVEGAAIGSNTGNLKFYPNTGSSVFTIDSTGTKTSGNNEVTGSSTLRGDVFAYGNIGSSTYSSGFGGSGWRIEKEDADYRGTLDYLTVRKSFNIYELNINKIRSGNGSYWFSDGAKVKSVTSSADNYHLWFDKEIGNPFTAGDVVRCQVWSGTGMKYYSGTVLGSDTSTHYYITIPKTTFSGDIPEAGDEIVRVNKGALYITSNDDNAPYMDVMYDQVVMSRFGRLDGITSQTFGNLSGYGFWTQNGYLEGGISAKIGDVAGILLDSEKMTAGNVQIWKTGDIINTASGNPFAFYGNGNFSLGKGQIGYNAATNVVSFADSVKLQWETYTNNAVDNVDVGSRNLLLNAFAAGKNTNVINNGIEIAANASGDTYFYLVPAFNLSEYNGQQITLSFKVSGLLSDKWLFAWKNKYDNNFRIWIKNGFNQITLTDVDLSGANILFDDHSQQTQNQPIQLTHFKLEKGNKATDWTPAPEDVDASIATKITSEQATVITNNTIKTTDVLAENLRIKFGNIDEFTFDNASGTNMNIGGRLTTNNSTEVGKETHHLSIDGYKIVGVNGAASIGADTVWVRDENDNPLAHFSDIDSYEAIKFYRRAHFTSELTVSSTVFCSKLDVGTYGIISDGKVEVNGLVDATTIMEGNQYLSDKYAAKSHSHSYLSLSGGTLTGALTIEGNLIVYKNISYNSYHYNGTTNASYPTTIDTNSHTLFTLGTSTAGRRHFTLASGTKNGQRCILVNINNGEAAFIKNILDGGKSNWWELGGGDILELMWVVKTVYNPTITGGHWFVTSYKTNNW